MFGMSTGSGQGFQVDLVSTEDQWRQLKRSATTLRSTASSQPTNPYRRRPVQNGSATTLVSDESPVPTTENEYLRQRQLETAKEIDHWLGTASELLSTASTVCAQRRSFGEQTVMPEQEHTAVVNYLIDPRNAEQANNRQIHLTQGNVILILSAYPFLSIGVFFMWIASSLCWCFMVVYLFFWLLSNVFIGFKNFRDHWTVLKRRCARVVGWYVAAWRNVLGFG